MKDYRLKKGQYSMAEAIEKMIKSYRLGDKVDLNKIKTYWREIAGDTIYKYTSDLFLRKNVLYIKVSNSILKQELSYMKAPLVEAVNNYFKKKVIDDIVIN